MTALQKLREDEKVEVKDYPKKLQFIYRTKDGPEIEEILREYFGDKKPEERVFIEGYAFVSYRRSQLKKSEESDPVEEMISDLEKLEGKVEVERIRTGVLRDRIPSATEMVRDYTRPSSHY